PCPPTPGRAPPLPVGVDPPEPGPPAVPGVPPLPGFAPPLPGCPPAPLAPPVPLPGRAAPPVPGTLSSLPPVPALAPPWPVGKLFCSSAAGRQAPIRVASEAASMRGAKGIVALFMGVLAVRRQRRPFVFPERG